MPAEPPFNKRGSFAGFSFDTAPRQLFVMKLMHAITGDEKWDAMYRAALNERDNRVQNPLLCRGLRHTQL